MEVSLQGREEYDFPMTVERALKADCRPSVIPIGRGKSSSRGGADTHRTFRRLRRT